MATKVITRDQSAINDWHISAKGKQPASKTMGLLVYVLNGRVVLLKDMVNEFPTADLPVARKLINEFIDNMIELAGERGMDSGQ